MESLAAAFQNKVLLVRQKLDLRSLECGARPDLITDIQKDVKDLKILLVSMRADNNQRRAKLQHIENLKSDVETMMCRIQHAASNLPSHLPSRIMPPPPPPPAAGPVTVPSSAASIRALPHTPHGFVLPETPASVSANTPSLEQIKRRSHALFLPAIDFLTTQEFDAVPKYMKGRLTYIQVNGAVEEFNKALDAKYSVLSIPKSKRSEKQKAMAKKYMELENKDTKGLQFVVDEDLKHHSNLRMDKLTHTLLTILRHCSRIKEVRSKAIVRYAVA